MPVLLAFVSPWIAGGRYVFVALLWLVPDRRIERMLVKREKISRSRQVGFAFAHSHNLITIFAGILCPSFTITVLEHMMIPPSEKLTCRR